MVGSVRYSSEEYPDDCPFCGNVEVEWEDVDVHASEQTLKEKFSCPGCKAEWVMKYEYTGWFTLQEPE